MICVTGAHGTLSSEVIGQLESAKAPLRAAHFSSKRAEAARMRGIEAVIIDYNRLAALRAAFQGCDKLFLLGPNALNQTQLELNAVETAKALTAPNHEERVYTLSGPEALTYDDLAKELSVEAEQVAR
ncbi:MAG: hypothetical protein ACREOO_01700 [bacterium]